MATRERERERIYLPRNIITIIIIILRITTYNVRLPEGVLTPSKLAAYVNLNNQIESNNEKKLKKQSKQTIKKRKT